MTTFNYSTKIIDKDLQSNTMIVEYTPLDNDVLTTSVPINASSIIDDALVPSTETTPRGRISIVVPIPFADQDLVEHIKSYAPLGVWEKMIEDAQKQISDVAVGESIIITDHNTTAITAPAMATIEIKKVVV